VDAELFEEEEDAVEDAADWDFEPRTRVHGARQPVDLFVPSGEGTVTRSEYMALRGG
jgi:hypothetical protein